MPIGEKIQTSSNPGEEVWVKRLELSKIFLIRPSAKLNAFILIIYLFDYIIIKVFLNVIVHRRAQRDNLKSVVFEETSYSNCSVAATCWSEGRRFRAVFYFSFFLFFSDRSLKLDKVEFWTFYISVSETVIL